MAKKDLEAEFKAISEWVTKNMKTTQIAVPKASARGKLLSIRCSDRELEVYQKVADKAGVPLSKLVRATLLKLARDTGVV